MNNTRDLVSQEFSEKDRARSKNSTWQRLLSSRCVFNWSDILVQLWSKYILDHSCTKCWHLIGQSRWYKSHIPLVKFSHTTCKNIAWSMRPSLVVSLDTNNGEVAAVQQPYWSTSIQASVAYSTQLQQGHMRSVQVNCACAITIQLQ